MKDEFRWFELEGDNEILAAIWGENDEAYDWTMEEYGVHDFSGSGATDPVYTMGYGSYEVEPENMDIVINGWRDHFVKCGFKCSNINTLLGEDSEEDGFKELGF